MKIEEKREKKKMGVAIRNGKKMIGKKVVGGGGGSCLRQPGCRVEASSMAIQRLFETCKAVFRGPAGTVPPPLDVQRLQALLDKMNPEDVGISKDLSRSGSAVKEPPRIICKTIHKRKNFSICMFLLPPTAVIPLHNHPGMTVLSKLLLGSMHIKAYDWVDPAKFDENMSLSRLRLARLKVDSDFTAPCNTSILYPTTGGNIHTFTAITPCAVLDVLGPSYSIEDGRDCTYYRDHPFSSSSDDAGTGARPEGGAGARPEGDGLFGWLEEIDIDPMMDPDTYLGPQIIDI